LEILPLPDHGGRAARDRFGDEGAAILRRAAIGHEDRAHLDGTRIGGEVGERHAQLRQAIEERGAAVAMDSGARDHPWSLVGCACTLSVPGAGAGAAGASGGTEVIRNAAFITLAKTGAPTSPPKWCAPCGSSIITATMKRGLEAGAKPTNEERYLCSA